MLRQTMLAGMAFVGLTALMRLNLADQALSARQAEVTRHPRLQKIPHRKVLLIGIDGCRLDAIERLRPTHLRQLIQQGCWAKFTRIHPAGDLRADTVSGPGWATLLTGVWPDQHGVFSNDFPSVLPTDCPNIFGRIEQNCPEASTVVLSSWAPVQEHLVREADEQIDLSERTSSYATCDREIVERAEEILSDQSPDLMFVYLAGLDEAGHGHGFHPSVPEYAAALHEIDLQLGRLIRRVDQRSRSLSEEWLILVVTDHGGTGLHHSQGHADPDVNRVFIIARGAGLEQCDVDGETSLIDVFPTIARHLLTRFPHEWSLPGRSLQSLVRERPGSHSLTVTSARNRH